MASPEACLSGSTVFSVRIYLGTEGKGLKVFMKANRATMVTRLKLLEVTIIEPRHEISNNVV